MPSAPPFAGVGGRAVAVLVAVGAVAGLLGRASSETQAAAALEATEPDP